MKRCKILIGFLALGIGLALLESRFVWAEEAAGYKIVMSKNQQLCTRVRDVLNKDLTEYGPGYDPHKFAGPIFSTIAWAPIKGLEEGFNYHGAVAHIDINNDGIMDAVVRQETHAGAGGMIGMHMLFVFKEDQYPKLAKQTSELEDNATGFVFLNSYEFRQLPKKTFQTSGMLKGKKYYEGMSNALFIHPFQLENRTYLLLTQSPDSPAVPNWALVAQYKQGKVRNADPTMMDDLCYLKLK